MRRGFLRFLHAGDVGTDRVGEPDGVDGAASGVDAAVLDGLGEWMYVLTGRLRLRLGSHDLVLAAGEGLGPQGQRAHVRARPRGTSGTSRA